MSWWSEIVEALFPEQCIACNRKGASLCAFCERTIITKPTMLGDWLVSLFEYRQPIVNKAIKDLKYRHHRGVSDYFGNALYREFFSPLSRKPEDALEIVLIPIPGTIEGNMRKGYNHAAEIALGVVKAAKADGLDMHAELDVLTKVCCAGQQAKASSRGAREKNMQGAFALLHPERVKGKHVVIIDDVVTTGETMKAARALLKKAGAKKVIGIAVAH